jgi:hypothetical protein
MFREKVHSQRRQLDFQPHRHCHNKKVCCLNSNNHQYRHKRRYSHHFHFGRLCKLSQCKRRNCRQHRERTGCWHYSRRKHKQ